MKCKGAVIGPEHLPPVPGGAARSPQPQRRRRLDTRIVTEALSQTNNNRVRAAKVLGVSRATLYRFLDGMKVDEDS